MLNVAIVDDEQDAVETLKNYVERYCGGHGIDCNAICFNSPVKFLARYKSDYDIVFLDIDMPDLNGMDAARNLRKIDGGVALIFVTNMAQYAIRGYEVDADDFIVKPIKYGNLEIKLDRVLKKHGKKDVPRVAVYDDGAARYIAVEEIRYVEVIKHSIIYHTVYGEYEKRGALKAEYALFTENGFAQCNKSCLVNLRFVLGVADHTLHIAKRRGEPDYDELSVSHPRKKEFVRTLNCYLEEHL